MTFTDRSLPETESQALLDAACARNLALELHYHAADGEFVVVRSRVLGMDEGNLYIDSPQMIGHDIDFSPRQDVQVHFNLQDSRYTFESHVLQRKSMVSLNDEKTVVGMILARPRRIQDGQRRNHFRVSLVAEEKLGIELHRTVTEDENIRPLDEHPMHGALINLSLGGVALRLSIEEGRTFTLNALVFIHFYLPEDEHDYLMLGEVRQLRPIADNTTMRLGIKFKAWPDERIYQHAQQRLQRYITKVQREQLRRAG